MSGGTVCAHRRAARDDSPAMRRENRGGGVVLECGGGHGVPGLRCRLDAAGKRIESLWPAPVAEFLRLLMRRSLALRTTAEARLEHDGIAYEARASARGPERALCIIRQASASS